MNPFEQNTAIALSLGYTYEDRVTTYDGAEIKFRLWRTPGGGGALPVKPNYTGDLNAMHEAEKSIKDAKDQMRYASEILMAMGFYNLMEASDLNIDYCWLVMGASAAERARAFLKTLNLWKP